MLGIHGFSDLCIPYTDQKQVLVDVVKQLIDYGYRNVAIEQTFDATDEKNIPKTREVFPEPKELGFLDEFASRIRILKRLTIVYTDSSISHFMTNSSNLKRFNIVAGMPMTADSLQHCCQSFNGDVICFSLDRSNLHFSRKYYNLAIERKLFFELRYAPAIIDSNHRRAIIRRSHAYHSYGKARNVIMSSGATDYIQLRTPYEVAHLGLLFGLSEEQGKNAMAGNCRAVIRHAEGRRFNKAVMVATLADEGGIGGDKPVPSSDDSEEEEEEDEAMAAACDGSDENEQPLTKKRKLK